MAVISKAISCETAQIGAQTQLLVAKARRATDAEIRVIYHVTAPLMAGWMAPSATSADEKGTSPAIARTLPLAVSNRAVAVAAAAAVVRSIQLLSTVVVSETAKCNATRVVAMAT
jgi:hypothetical protein